MNDTGNVGSDRHWAMLVALAANAAFAWMLSSLLQSGARPAPSLQGASRQLRDTLAYEKRFCR